jgi:predicted transcriptional regulator
MNKLAHLANVVPSTILSRIDKINKYEKVPIYQNKDCRKITDEALIELVNKNPELNMRESAEVAGVTQSTISLKILNINGSGGEVNYIKSTQRFTDEALIGLINKNPQLNIKELAKTAGVQISTISKRIKMIKSSGEEINYIKTSHKFPDEALIGLINKNPQLNIKELAKIAGIGKTTLARRVEEINSSGREINYIKKSA